MKKLFTFLAFILSFVVYAQQRSACTYTTCSPQIPFQNTDLFQIYGATLKSTSVTINGGTVSVACGTCVQTVKTSTVANEGFSVAVVETGNLGGFTSKPTVSITANGTYATGDNIGGVGTFIACRTDQVSGVLNDITVFDPSGTKPDILIDIWQTTPTGVFTDNSPTEITSPALYLGSITVSNSQYLSSLTSARVSLTGLSIAFVTDPGSVNLYFTVQATAASTFPGSTNLYFRFGLLQD